MIKEDSITPQLDKLVLELRRGILVLATLSQMDEAKYGYALIQQLAEQGLVIEQGTLYPLLRRLEEQGLLLSQWDVEGSRPRKYYELSPIGQKVLVRLIKEWNEIVYVMDDLISPEVRKFENGHD